MVVSPNRDVAGGGAGEALHRRGQPQELVDRVGDQLGVLGQQPPLVGPLMQQLHGAAEHSGRGVVAAGDHRERERQDRQHARDVTVGADAGGHQMRDGVVLGFGATPFDQRGEVGHHLAECVAETAERSGDAAGSGVGRDDRLGPAVELVAVLLGDPEIVRDDHRRQRLEQLGDDVAAAVGAQPLDALDDELADLGLDRLDLPRSEAPRHQLAKLGVHRRVLHHDRRIVLQADQFELAVVDRQALRRREGLVVAGRGPDVGVPGHHVVVVVGLVLRG